MSDAVRDAYGRRAAEYAELLGSMAATHPMDRTLVSSWAEPLDGPVLDAGCGPGQWTRFLRDRGADAHGLDQVPEFIEHARRTHPGPPFELGSLDALPDADGSLAGILAWYSLIHHDPGAIDRPLSEFARALRPGGGILLGFVLGETTEPFDHAVVRAYRWTFDALGERLIAAGFEVVETHSRTAPDQRPHGAISAIRAGTAHRS
ncbi:class I SAM-dependent methyltransferase [Agromyces sp. LHK192]|uniref:class I SAM-dependent methyltransferase n=1 Tax=Agromyces sp. LHK192 TaxID=2498704 RepID=UPI000FD8F375|nr:class I SAM-dependent methyltransferase [Agromyces sp. LHK192]